MNGIKSATLPKGAKGTRAQTGPGPGTSCASARGQNRLQPGVKKATSPGPGRPLAAVQVQDTTIGGHQAPVVVAHPAVTF